MKVLVLYSTSGKKKFEKEFIKLKQLVATYPQVELIDIGDSSKSKGKHYRSVRRAIFEADAVIIDNSKSSFKLGHEASIALAHHKPTLVLSQSEDMSEFIDHPNFFGAKYVRLNLAEIVESFLRHASRKRYSQRLNMFISIDQEDFIESAALSLNISKSQYVRQLIDERMRGKDYRF